MSETCSDQPLAGMPSVSRTEASSELVVLSCSIPALLDWCWTPVMKNLLTMRQSPLWNPGTWDLSILLLGCKAALNFGWNPRINWDNHYDHCVGLRETQQETMDLDIYQPKLLKVWASCEIFNETNSAIPWYPTDFPGMPRFSHRKSPGDRCLFLSSRHATQPCFAGALVVAPTAAKGLVGCAGGCRS